VKPCPYCKYSMQDNHAPPQGPGKPRKSQPKTPEDMKKCIFGGVHLTAMTRDSRRGPPRVAGSRSCDRGPAWCPGLCARCHELHGDARGRTRTTSTCGSKLGHFNSPGETMSTSRLFEPDRTTACALLTGQRTQGVSSQTPYDRAAPQKSLGTHTDYRKGDNFIGLHVSTCL